MTDKPAPGYGIDAPGVVRTLMGFGSLLIGLAALITALGTPSFLLALAPTFAFTGAPMVLMALWMLVSSLWLKKRVMKTLLDARIWRGDEQVLDVGCGRGLFAIGAARRLLSGRVEALDLWQAEDLSGNTAQALVANALAANVSNRIVIETGDARALPYSDGAFDVVGSMTVIHNIPSVAERVKAIDEMWRVLSPGGQMLL